MATTGVGAKGQGVSDQSRQATRQRLERLERRECARGQRRVFRRMRVPLATGVLTLLLIAVATVTSPSVIALAAPLTSQTPQRAMQATHALPVREDPAADAILAAPPAQVKMWFSEDLNPLTSRLVVVDTTNHQVDVGDSQVSASNPLEMSVSLPLLRAGTYVVVWRTQSADDGHIASGSYLFRIARPDGSVPPVPAVLPTPHITGGQALATGTLDGPTLVQTAMTWLALLLMVFWVGGVIWETWILAPRRQTDPDLHAAALAATARFRLLAPYALGLLLVANVGVIVAEAAELAGEWSGAVSLPLLHAIIFGSRFGLFWWMRQLAVIAALAATLLTRPQTAVALSLPAAPTEGAAATALDVSGRDTPAAKAPALAIPDWRRELLKTLRELPQLPRQIWQGLRARTGEGIVLLVLGGALIAAFALSGHAAAVSASELGYALSVDIFHLIATTAWLGGLLYITVVLLPALRRLTAHQQARVLALGLPQFGALALVCAVLLAATGSLSATIHLTSITQFFTTTYGRTLAVKIELFLLMAAISAYHAFFLRPRLALALNDDADGAGRGARSPALSQEPHEGEPHDKAPAHRRGQTKRAGAAIAGQNALALAGAAPASSASSAQLSATPALSAVRPASIATPGRESLVTSPAPASGATERLPERLPAPAPTQRLARAIEEWLAREAALGVGVLLCVALLSAFAGSLYSLPLAPTSHSTGAFAQTQTAGSYQVTLNVSPDSFGTNTFTVTVMNAQKQPIAGAAVLLQEGDLDMDMGVQTFQLNAKGASSPGVYTEQSDILMAGHWSILVKVLPPKSNQFHTATFKLTVSY